MEKFETNHPELCKVVEIGTTTKGRKLLCAKISDNVKDEVHIKRFLIGKLKKVFRNEKNIKTCFTH